MKGGGGGDGVRSVGAGAVYLLGDCNGMRPSQNECLMTGLHVSHEILAECNYPPDPSSKMSPAFPLAAPASHHFQWKIQLHHVLKDHVITTLHFKVLLE